MEEVRGHLDHGWADPDTGERYPGWDSLSVEERVSPPFGIVPAPLGCLVVDVDDVSRPETTNRVVEAVGNSLVICHPTSVSGKMHAWVRVGSENIGPNGRPWTGQKWSVEPGPKGSASGEFKCERAYVCVWDPKACLLAAAQDDGRPPVDNSLLTEWHQNARGLGKNAPDPLLDREWPNSTHEETESAL